jgi:flavin reductase (DIM6/NTAB) family NADH-FMN oxidoreductase RutF
MWTADIQAPRAIASLVSFSIANASRTWPALCRAGHVGVTVLADHHGAAARQLAGPSDTRFDGLDVTFGDEGVVMLADGIASIDKEVAAGDHTIILLRLHTAAHAEHSLPLVFHRSGIGLRRPV